MTKLTKVSSILFKSTEKKNQKYKALRSKNVYMWGPSLLNVWLSGPYTSNRLLIIFISEDPSK